MENGLTTNTVALPSEGQGKVRFSARYWYFPGNFPNPMTQTFRRGDFGGGITMQLAPLFHQLVEGIHLNFVPWFTIPDEGQAGEERRWLADDAAYTTREVDHMWLEANRPMMPAIALLDSPIGTVAWIAENSGPGPTMVATSAMFFCALRRLMLEGWDRPATFRSHQHVLDYFPLHPSSVDFLSI